MRFYEGYLQELGFETDYVEANVETSEIRTLVKNLSADGISRIRYIDPVDDWLSRRLERAAKKYGVETEIHDSPAFINTRESLSKFFREDKKKFYQTAFYKDERRRLGVLIDSKGDPEGGKWTFDTENRKKYPAKKTPPGYSTLAEVELAKEASEYVSKKLSKCYKGKSDGFRLSVHTQRRAGSSGAVLGASLRRVWHIRGCDRQYGIDIESQPAYLH